MKRTWLLFAVLFLITTLLLAACGTQQAGPTQAPQAETKETTALIGFTASQTGSYNVESTRQIKKFSTHLK